MAAVSVSMLKVKITFPLFLCFFIFHIFILSDNKRIIRGMMGCASGGWVAAKLGLELNKIKFVDFLLFLLASELIAVVWSIINLLLRYWNAPEKKIISFVQKLLVLPELGCQLYSEFLMLSCFYVLLQLLSLLLCMLSVELWLWWCLEFSYMLNTCKKKIEAVSFLDFFAQSNIIFC